MEEVGPHLTNFDDLNDDCIFMILAALFQSIPAVWVSKIPCEENIRLYNSKIYYHKYYSMRRYLMYFAAINSKTFRVFRSSKYRVLFQDIKAIPLSNEYTNLNGWKFLTLDVLKDWCYKNIIRGVEPNIYTLEIKRRENFVEVGKFRVGSISIKILYNSLMHMYNGMTFYCRIIIDNGNSSSLSKGERDLIFDCGENLKIFFKKYFSRDDNLEVRRFYNICYKFGKFIVDYVKSGKMTCGSFELDKNPLMDDGSLRSLNIFSRK